MTLDELLDREMIRDVLAQYSCTKDLGQGIEASVNSFHPAGELEKSSGAVLHGHEEIAEFFTAIGKSRSEAGGPGAFARHVLYTPFFEFPGPARATTVTYLLTFTESGLEQVTTYDDALVKEDGRWSIMRRKISMEYQLPGGRLELPDMHVRSW